MEDKSKVEEINPASVATESAAPKVAAAEENNADLSQQMADLTIFGNKSRAELQQIQSKDSHLSAGLTIPSISLTIFVFLFLFLLGILFSDPSLRM
jgi:hypothetical protein